MEDLYSGLLNQSSIHPVQTILIALFSAAVSAACGFAALHLSDALPSSINLIVLGLVALFIGLLHGKLFGPAAYKAVGVGAFLGLCIIWTPMALITNGWALAGLPYLVAYAGIAAVGVQWSAKLAPRKSA
jgi:1,4-dihydroxy-2-naphthoate octaprenyltransferase